MRIVIGEVSGEDGSYKMLRAVHMEITDADWELDPESFIAKYLYPATIQLVEWHDAEAVKH